MFYVIIFLEVDVVVFNLRAFLVLKFLALPLTNNHCNCGFFKDTLSLFHSFVMVSPTMQLARAQIFLFRLSFLDFTDILRKLEVLDML